MRTSEHTRRSIRSATIGLAVLMGIGTAGIAEAQTAATVEAPILQFHSFKDASPRVAARILAGPSLWKGNLKSAREAWRKGQYKKAKAAFERAWNNGNLVAAWYLGHIYRLGRGAKADPKRAFFFYRQRRRLLSHRHRQEAEKIRSQARLPPVQHRRRSRPPGGILRTGPDRPPCHQLAHQGRAWRIRTGGGHARQAGRDRRERPAPSQRGRRSVLVHGCGGPGPGQGGRAHQKAHQQAARPAPPLQTQPEARTISNGAGGLSPLPESVLWRFGERIRGFP